MTGHPHRLGLPALLGAVLVLLWAPARAQMDLPDAGPGLDGKTLFRNQCATCHAIARDAPNRQGPNLYGVVGRRAGHQPGYSYSGSLAKVDFVWDTAHLDPWLADPQAVVPGTIMMYHQAKPAVRQAIIQYLTEQR